MIDNLCGKTKLKLEPDPGWSWEGWNGELIIEGEDRGVKVDGQTVVVKTDLISAARSLVGKTYKAMGFDTVPGYVISATIDITESTLSTVTKLGVIPAATKRTIGTFSINIFPSKHVSSVTILDPMSTRTGKLSIVDTGQSLACSE